jgi:hypothetical protein
MTRAELADSLTVERFTHHVPGDDKCGTYAGYQRHIYYKEPTCDRCREAQREYMRAYRQRPAARRTVNAQQAARSRALWRLVDMHPGEFQLLYEAELEAL